MIMPQFLGNGIVRPFRRDGKGDIANDSGVALIKACVAQVLGTDCEDPSQSTVGELPWRPEFGSLLSRIRHRKGPAISELARHYVVDAIQKWEPRVIVKSVSITFSDRTLTIHLRYDVIAVNSSSNNVVYDDVEQDVTLSTAA